MIRIVNLAQLTDATKELCALDSRFLDIVKRYGLPSLRGSPEGLESLLSIITGQFLSLQAADTIWLRIKHKLGPCEKANVHACSLSGLVALGLSNTKAKAFHAAAAADLDFTGLDESTVIKKLCAIHGVGPWTADIYLLSALGAADTWPKGDLALRIAAQDFLQLPSRPEITEMDELAENWRPYRAVAARLLWSHYRGLKGLEQA